MYAVFPTFVITLRSPDTISSYRFTLRAFGFERSWSGWCWNSSEHVNAAYTVRLDPSQQSSVWISVLYMSTAVKRRRSCACVQWLQFSEAKDQVYRELTQLLRSARSKDVMIVADDFNAQLGHNGDKKVHRGVILSQPIGPTREIVSSTSTLTRGYFWKTPIFVIKHNEAHLASLSFSQR